MVKWTTPDPNLVFNESDSKLYTNFEFCEEKRNHRNLRNMMIYKAKQFYDDKIIPRKVYIS